MKSTLKRLFIIALCVCLCLPILNNFSLSSSADATEDALRNEIAQLQAQSKEIEKEINRLKGEKSNQNAVLSAIQKKISNTQAQINRCNQEINKINSKIAANKAEIDKTNTKIEDQKTAFKKRIRAIYMSNSGSNVQILLGADDFSSFLQLAQLTASISSHDKKMIEDMVEVIKGLEEKNRENEELLKNQMAVKATIDEAQAQLEQEEAEAMKLYNSISSSLKSEENSNAAIEQEIKEKTNYLNDMLYGGQQYNSFVNTKEGFIWPVPSCQNITSYYGQRWGTMHRGIDISNGSIYGKPIVAITDGVVYRTYSACPHKSKSSRCRCGSGWGNHVGVNHGNINGVVYKAMYAHMDSIAVSNGQSVTQGQIIGYVGTTGDSTGYHLHFGLMVNDNWVNPMNYYRKVG